MILLSFLFLLLSNNEKKLNAKLTDMLRELNYDSVVVNYDKNLFNSGKWVKDKVLHPGTNFIRIKQEFKSKIVSVSIQLYKKAFVLKNYVKRSNRIKRSDYEIKMVNITHLRDPISEDNMKVNRFAKKSLRIGSILTARNTRAEYDVMFGETVQLLYKTKRIKMTIPVTARASGFVGELILVEMKNGKRLKASLTSKGMVKYEKN